jgi:hypothetical protein
MNSPRNKYEIAKEALVKKSEIFLNPPVSFVGRRGFEKLIQDLPQLKNEMIKADYDKILENMVIFFGTVPTIPKRCVVSRNRHRELLRGFDKMGRVLEEIGKRIWQCDMLEHPVFLKQGAEKIS